MFTKVRVALTRTCQMSCVYCPRGPLINMENFDGRETYCLSDDEVLGILSVIAEHGLKNVHFTGGEPLQRKGIISLVRETTKMGAAVELNTNGIGLNTRKTQQLREAGLFLLKVSLDAPNRGAFLSFTGLDAFERVVNGIRSALSVMPVRLNCVVMRSNIGTVVPLIKMANDLGVPQIHLLDLTYYPCVGGKTFWEREFVYLTKELSPILEKEFNRTFKLSPIFGCRFHEMESIPGGTIVVVKEAQPTMRAPECCDNCHEYCHEGVFTLRLSAGGYLNFCPCSNAYGVNALELYRQGRLGETLEAFSNIFDRARSVESFSVFLKKNGLEYKEANEE